MRKTFVVGKLTCGTTRIVLVETGGMPTPALLQMLRVAAKTEASTQLPDPLTVH